MCSKTLKSKLYYRLIQIFHLFVLAIISWEYGFTTPTNIPKSLSPKAPGSPASPINLTVFELTQSLVRLTWTDRSNDEQGFKIDYLVDSGDWTNLAAVESNVTTYIHFGVAPGHTYCYRVYAYNQAGDSGFTNQACLTIESTIPFPPSDLHADPISDTQIYLHWTDNSYNETGFGIESRVNFGTWSLVTEVPTNVNYYTHSNLTTNQTYCYRVYATNGTQHSAYSNESCAILIQRPAGILDRFWKSLK